MVYDEAHQKSPLEDHIQTIAKSDDVLATPANPQFGIDSYFGLVASFLAAPLYLYSTLKGKHQVWDEILDGLPENCFLGPALDVGCGRGMVLLKIAERKKKLAEKLVSDAKPASDAQPVHPAYGTDIFNTSDQSGNSPVATYKNAVAMGVTDYAVLHTTNFTDRFPFADGVFPLVTTCLTVHNVDGTGRKNAVKEMARVCATGGRIIMVDLYGYFKDHQKILEGLKWKDVKVSIVGFRMSYGVLPCQMLTAQKPKA